MEFYHFAGMSGMLLKMTKSKYSTRNFYKLQFFFLLSGKCRRQWLEQEQWEDNWIRGFLHCDMIWKPTSLVPLVTKLDHLPYPVPLPGSGTKFLHKVADLKATCLKRRKSHRWHFRIPLYERKGCGLVILIIHNYPKIEW